MDQSIQHDWEAIASDLARAYQAIRDIHLNTLNKIKEEHGAAAALLFIAMVHRLIEQPPATTNIASIEVRDKL